MAQHNKTEVGSDEELLTANSKAVVDIAKYQQHEEKTPESSAFEQVMQQMNIANRLDFDKQYELQWVEASEEQSMLSVLICEIDFFKAYTDNYGHQGASFMLLVVGLALKKTCEELNCFLARYNGDEFAILVKGGDTQHAAFVGESLRKAVENTRTEHKYSNVSDIVTLSIGVSSVYPTSMKLLMKEADMALSTAKVSGRNQVSSHFVQREQVNSESTSASNISAEPSVTVPALSLEEPSVVESSDFERLMGDMDIPDRRDFNSYFVHVWKETSIDKELLTMIRFDIDYFKAYLAHYGQQTSEDALLIVACTIKRVCDEYGCFMSRLEGEKFVALIKGGNATKGLKISEAIRQGIEELSMEHVDSPVSNLLTLSIGLSNIFPSELNSMKVLMAKVDAALNDAKSSGHNQISVND